MASIFENLIEQLQGQGWQVDQAGRDALPRMTPFQPIAWPGQSHIKDQIQQVKTAAQPVALANKRGNQGVSSINMPSHATGLKISKTLVGGSQFRMTARFTLNQADPNLSHANIHLRYADGTTRLVTSTKQSPVTFYVPKGDAASAVVVQTEGNWGANPIEQSPSKVLSGLRNSSIVPTTGVPQAGAAFASSGASVNPTPPLAVIFEANGALLLDQTVVNFKQGLGMAVTNSGAGDVQFDVTGLQIIATVGENISSYQVVKIGSDGLAYVADSATLGDLALTVGIALTSASASPPGQITIQIAGEVDNTGGWFFTPGDSVYLGTSGALVNNPNTGLFEQPMGTASDVGKVLLEVGMSIQKA